MSDLLNISEMSGKLKYFRAISQNPLTNDYCNNECGLRGVCYSKRLLTTARKNAVPSFERNNRLLSTSLITRDNIKANFKVGEHVRLLAHGELINDLNFLNYCKIATFYPYSIFTLWTKQKDIVQDNKDFVPGNLRLIYSSPQINPSKKDSNNIPQGFTGLFNVYTKDYVDKNNIIINCKKNCVGCLRCYTLENFITNELISLSNNDTKRYEELNKK